MIEPNESRIAVLRVKVRPLARENVRVDVDLHESNCRAFLRNANQMASDTDALQFQKGSTGLGSGTL